MKNDLEKFAELVLGVELLPHQRELLEKLEKNPNFRIVVMPARRWGKTLTLAALQEALLKRD